MYSLFLYIFCYTFFSDAIYIHPQEHKLQSTAYTDLCVLLFIIRRT
jgi:hypothetical protein